MQLQNGKKAKPSEIIDQERPVDQMTWAPGEKMLIRDRLVDGGGWISEPGCNCFNLYRPPKEHFGDAAEAGPWLDHVRKVFPEDAEHIINYLAHRVQRPGEKPNHALVLGSTQGTGKDTILEPVKYAVGPWNFAEISPAHLLGRFNGFVKCVILRISEARDLGDIDRYAFYEHTKTYLAAPPDVLRCDEKNLREHSVMNVCGVIITTNHKSDGIYLPADDRRHYVAWSERTAVDFNAAYWNDLYAWYRKGGIAHVAAFLGSLDLTHFDAKAPPPKTAAFWAIVDANRAPEDAELADVIDALKNPDTVTALDVMIYASEGFQEWLKDRRNRRLIPHRLEAVGYTPVRNNAATDGLWRLDGRRQVIYAKKELSVRDRLASATRLVTRSRQ